MGTRAAIYCRLSNKGGRSIERQEQDGRSIAKARRWSVVRVFAETASASEFAKRAREQWELLLAAVRDREFDAVIVWLEDRSNRDVVKAAEFVQLCRKAGTRLVIADSEHEYDFTDPEQTARFYGEVAHAQREVARLSKRVRRFCLQEAQEGLAHHGGRRAFGTVGAGKSRVSPAQAERERELIREAAIRIRDGDSLRGIVVEWTDRGITSSQGKPWTTRPLRRLLLEARLVGLREHRGTLYPSHSIKPVLDRELWETVRAILTDPARQVAAVGGTPRYLLTGLAFCGVCKAKLRVEYKDGRRYYICPSRGGGGRRCIRRIADPVDRLIEGALFEGAETQAWDQAAADRPADDPTRSHTEALVQLTADLDVLDGMLAEAELAERQGRTPKPSAATLRRKLAERERERDRHQAAVARLQRGRVVTAVPRNLRELWPSFSLDRQRAILKAVLRLPPEGYGILIHPTGQGRRTFDPDAIDPDWRE